ncbi:DUF935 domain-containing protein [bacterium]|nr:MAG: DUF935 domain-containing protein [bacterium]
MAAQTIYDSFGCLVAPSPAPEDRTIAVASIRDRYSSYPSNGLTPERLAAILKEADAGYVYRQMELFEEMEEKDAHLLAILQQRKLSVAGLDFEVKPFSEDTRDRAVADFVAGVINGLPDFEDNLVDMLDAVGKGFSALELSWDMRGGKHAVRHMEWIQPKRFVWPYTMRSPQPEVPTDTRSLNVPRLITDALPMGMDIPPFKLVFHRHKTKSGHDTRQGVLRVCAWMYLFKNYDIKDWVVFAEVFGMPLRLGKYDPSATKEDRDALVQAVRSLGSDAAGVISKSTEIEFVESVKNSGKDVYEVLAAFCNAEMSKAVLGHSAGADSTPGKLGNESVAMGVRADIQKADCESIAKTLRRDLIRPLVGFNFGWDVPLPWFKLHYENQADLNIEATRYKTLVETGLPISAEHMYDKFGIPKPVGGEEVVKPISAGQAGMPDPLVSASGVSAGAHKACACKIDAHKSGGADQRDALDALTGRLMAEADFAPIMEPVAKLVAGAESLEDLRDRLIEMYAGMDAQELGNLMQRAFTAAELLGRFDAAPQKPD